MSEELTLKDFKKSLNREGLFKITGKNIKKGLLSVISTTVILSSMSFSNNVNANDVIKLDNPAFSFDIDKKTEPEKLTGKKLEMELEINKNFYNLTNEDAEEYLKYSSIEDNENIIAYGYARYLELLKEGDVAKEDLDLAKMLNIVSRDALEDGYYIFVEDYAKSQVEKNGYTLDNVPQNIIDKIGYNKDVPRLESEGEVIEHLMGMFNDDKSEFLFAAYISNDGKKMDKLSKAARVIYKEALMLGYDNLTLKESTDVIVNKYGNGKKGIQLMSEKILAENMVLESRDNWTIISKAFVGSYKKEQEMSKEALSIKTNNKKNNKSNLKI